MAAVISVVSAQVSECAVRQRHQDHSGGQQRQRGAPSCARPREDQQRHCQDCDIEHGVCQRQAQRESACAACLEDALHDEHPRHLEECARHDEAVEHEADSRVARVSNGEEHYGQSRPDREQQVSQIRRRREWSLVKHVLVVDPQRRACRPSGQANRQTDPRGALSAFSRSSSECPASRGENRQDQKSVISDRFASGVTRPRSDQSPSERNACRDSADPRPRCSRHPPTLATNRHGRNPSS